MEVIRMFTKFCIALVAIIVFPVFMIIMPMTWIDDQMGVMASLVYLFLAGIPLCTLLISGVLYFLMGEE